MLDVHYFAAARAAAGTAQEQIPTAQVPTYLGELLDQLAAAHSGTTEAGVGLAEILQRCTFLVDGAAAGDNYRQVSLDGVARVDVLPPFAGG